MKPAHGSLSKTGTQVDRTIGRDRKTRPGSFCLANNEGRVLEHSWNAGNHFHQSGHTLFLTGETHKGVRFLMR
jgi:hypothetical protein